jgi:hypothetical protein
MSFYDHYQIPCVAVAGGNIYRTNSRNLRENIVRGLHLLVSVRCPCMIDSLILWLQIVQ